MLLRALLPAFAAAFAPALFRKAPLVAPLNLQIVRTESTDIMAIASTLEGPGIPYGPDGVAKGHFEDEVKSRENFGLFLNAVHECGLTDLLNGDEGGGRMTLFLPVDSVVEAYNGPLDEAFIKHHIVPEELSSRDIANESEVPTLQGEALSIRKLDRGRKLYVEGAVLGQAPWEQGAAWGRYPVDVECSNGVIHAIDNVLPPGEGVVYT